MAETLVNFEQSVEITNSMEATVDLWIEPWAEHFSMSPGASRRIVCNSKLTEPIIIEFRREGIVVYGTRGSTMSVFDGNRQIWECHERLAP
jgi:hypothetical protein